jgi:heme b synthase
MEDSLRLVFWELTAACNLKCQHCRAEAQEEAMPDELSTEDVISVAKDIRKVGDPIMILTGGEPLARKDFFEIARACTGMFSRVALATNGTLVTDAIAKEVADCGIQRTSISIDGATAKTHDDFRRMPGSFDASFKGWEALRSAGVSVQMNVTVARNNVDQLEDILALAIERGADAFHAFVLVPVGCGAQLGDDVRLNDAEMDKVLRWLFDKSIELRGKLHIKATCAPQYYRIMREVSKERGISMQPKGHGMHATTRGCLAGSSVCFISRTGDVQPCGYLPVQVGNVMKENFGDIWNNSEEFQKLRNPSELKGKCNACGYRTVCAGCRARAYADSSDFLAEDPDCLYIP